jgi:hypothetical protein
VPSAAEEPRRRIDLDDVAGARIDLDAVYRSGSPKVVFARVSFLNSGLRRCPEDSGTLQISGGTLAQNRMAMLADPEGQGSFNGWRSTMSSIDDETFQYRVTLPDCRMDIEIRHQISRDGAWTSQLIGREQRPSVPVEERRTLERQRLDVERLLGEAPRVRPGYHQELSTKRQAFFFDGAEPKCFKAEGFYRVDRTGIVFSFQITQLPELPDFLVDRVRGAGALDALNQLRRDLNRFVIERSNLDENRSRLHFTSGDCRWELTISQSVLQNGEWHALPLTGR